MKKKAANLTPTEQRALRVKQLQVDERRALGDVKFGIIKSWQAFFTSRGLATPSEYTVADKPFSYLLVKEWFSAELEKVKTLSDSELASGDVKVITTEQSEDKDPSSDADKKEVRKLAALYDNPRVRPLAFQNKAAVRLLDGILVQHKRGQLLQAPVGCGKTFILGALIRELLDNKWEVLERSLSPCKILYLTKATIVTQTERVLHDKFGLVTGDDVVVTNIDQLRSKYGSFLLKEDTIVKFNQVEIIYRWFPRTAPVLLIVDESQGVKNENATQTKQVAAFSDLPDDGTHFSIHSSATPFTRVSEAKVFAVSTGLTWV